MNIRSFESDLKSDKQLLGINISFPAPGIIEKIGANWDWIWIDGQHGQHSYDSMLACVRACDLVGTMSVIRVPGHDYGSIGLALDTGASGIMIPMVDTVKQADDIVKATRFPPLGRRSFGGRRLIDLYGRTYAKNSNDRTTVIAQIETDEGLSNVESIAALEGIDVIFFSPDDMAMQRNIPMDKPRAKGYFAKEMERLAKAASDSGKAAGTVATDPEAIKFAYELGYRLFGVASDAFFLADGSNKLKMLLQESI